MSKTEEPVVVRLLRARFRSGFVTMLATAEACRKMQISFLSGHSNERMTSKRGPLLVAAGLITHENRVLVGQRRRGDRHALKWEFPGGKVEVGESPQQALVRELREELNIEATVGAEVARYVHNYPSGATVHLLFYAVTTFRGEPACRAFEQISWENLDRLPEIDFLDGDLDFVRRLASGEFRATLSPETKAS